MNGARVGDHVMDPGQTVYDRRVLFLSHDVSGMLKPGAVNVLGVELGQYMYTAFDTFCNATKLGPRNCLAFILRLDVALSDGSRMTILSEATSGEWLARSGPIVYDQLYQGEIFDARREQSGALILLARNLSSTCCLPCCLLMILQVGTQHPQLPWVKSPSRNGHRRWQCTRRRWANSHPRTSHRCA